ncbi:hypothetical protein ACQPZJ_35440 [Actinoplanes sp. CA-054009]
MAQIRVEGLRAFTAALRRIDDKYPAQLRKSNLGVARSVGIEAKRNARSYVAQKKYYRESGNSIRAASAGVSAVLKGGGADTPYFWAAEYGGYRRTGWYGANPKLWTQRRQWLPWRGNQWGGWSGGPGYMINPAIRDHAPELIAKYEKEILALYKEAFPH